MLKKPPALGAKPITGEPAPIAPALATLAKGAPAGAGWFAEIKFDGYRMLAGGRSRRTVIRSRNAIDWTAKLPELATELAWLVRRGAVLDGEVVAYRPDGVSSFELLKARLGDKDTAGLVYMVFDLLTLDGWDLRSCRQDDRSSLLERLLGEQASTQVRISERQDDAVAAFGRSACTHGSEGIVAKRRDARYMSGRGKAWLKVKCGHRQEFVIVGFTDPEGERVGFGALLPAYHEGSRWLYAGGVGTGYSDRFLRDFRGRLEAIEQTTPTVTMPKGVSSRGVHWVEPCYVGEVAFTEWTRDGILRHPSFLGLRDDKRPKDVVRELPVAPAGH